MDLRGVRLTHIAYYSFFMHTKQLLFVTFCDTVTGIGDGFWTHGWRRRTAAEGQTDVEVEIVI